MRFTVFNFLALQIIAWLLFFNGGKQATEYAHLTDTWEVVNIDQQNDDNVILHYPTFNQLTLNADGTFERLKLDGSVENGQWFVDKNNAQLTLSSPTENEEYQIIQLPTEKRNLFIIKEFKDKSPENSEQEYRLTRL